MRNEEYRESIIKMVQSMKSLRFLISIHSFVKVKFDKEQREQLGEA